MGFPRAPLDAVSDDPRAIRAIIRQVAVVVNRMLTGKLNNTALITLDANAASTTFTDERFTHESQVSFTPTTANAAAEIGNSTLYVSETGRKNGELTVTHANNAQTDRIFRASILG